MEPTPLLGDAATRFHRIAKQVLRTVVSLQNLAIRFQRDQPLLNALEVKNEYVHPFLTLLREMEELGDLENALAQFARAALALKLDATRRKFRNIEAPSVHGLTVQICCFFLELWNRSFALKPGDPIPVNARCPDLIALSELAGKFTRMLEGAVQVSNIPAVRECLRVNDPVEVGLRWFLNDCFTCLNEWNPSSLFTDLEWEIHTVRDADNQEPTPGGRKSENPQTAGRKKKATINMRMLEIMQSEPEAMGWTTTQWQQRLKCRSRSAITDTQTWKNLESYRLTAKAEKRIDKRRRPRHHGSDRG